LSCACIFNEQTIANAIIITMLSLLFTLQK
jgi:hypothetical protein